MIDETAIKLRTGLAEHMQEVTFERNAREGDRQQVGDWLHNSFRNGLEQRFRQAMPNNGFLVTKERWESDQYRLEFSFSYLPDQPDSTIFPQEIERDISFDIEWQIDTHNVVRVTHTGEDDLFATVEVVQRDFEDFVVDNILKALKIERERRRSPWPHEIGG